MQPTRSQRLFAGEIPFGVIMWLSAIAFTAWIADGLRPLLEPKPGSVAYFAFLMIVTIVLAFIVGSIVAWIVIDPINTWCGRRNGAPYKVGDYVRILAPGRHRDRVVRVQVPLSSREQVVVELGDRVTECFPHAQVCREPHT